jgi:hypothetical protein
MNSVAWLGSTPAASQSMTMSQVACSMPCGLSYCVVRACQSATKNRHGILMLELDPVLENPVVVAEMKRAGGAHAGKNTFCVHSRSVKPKNGFDGPRATNDQRVHDGTENTGE